VVRKIRRGDRAIGPQKDRRFVGVVPDDDGHIVLLALRENRVDALRQHPAVDDHPGVGVIATARLEQSLGAVRSERSQDVLGQAQPRRQPLALLLGVGERS
jgi:hypothetical protein